MFNLAIHNELTGRQLPHRDLYRKQAFPQTIDNCELTHFSLNQHKDIRHNTSKNQHMKLVETRAPIGTRERNELPIELVFQCNK